MTGRKVVFYQASWGPHALKPGTPNDGGPCTARCTALGEGQVVAMAGALFFELPESARVARIGWDGDVMYELGRWIWRKSEWVQV